MPEELPPSVPSPDPIRLAAMPTADEQVERELRRLTRRGFLVGGTAALAGAGGLTWLATRAADGGIAWPLRKVLETNQSFAERLLPPTRLAPTFSSERIGEPRVNGRYGLHEPLVADKWKLRVQDQHTFELPLAAIEALPRHEIICEFKCVEGWSQIVQWAGARLADFATKYGLRGNYVSLETPDRQYYVGLDIASALHPQTLLAYEMNGQPLTPGHGAPLRLVSTVKYGVKSLKRIGSIQCTNTRPKCFWAERGYDWYLGL